MPVWRADNGVILCAGVADTGIIPLRYITQAVGVRDGVRIWPRAAHPPRDDAAAV